MADITGSLQTAWGPDLLVGFATADDAAVYRLDTERAVVCTADFITPVVDDPFTFGQVAAANSLSDVYAMGGVPLVALNLLGYPPAGLPSRVLGEILAGGADMCARAGCAVGGGHSVRDEEVKFGLSVTGLVHPDRILRNSTARAGDVLILTKPLGTGALVAALKKGVLQEAGYQALVTCMTTLNTPGLRLHALGAAACTDVTGFGLVGHALEMAQGADLCFRFRTGALPLLPEAVALCGQGFTCAGTKANAGYTAEATVYEAGVAQDMIGLLNDPQTSGGLLISVPSARAAAVTDFLAEQGALACRIVGEAVARSLRDPHLVFSV